MTVVNVLGASFCSCFNERNVISLSRAFNRDLLEIDASGSNVSMSSSDEDLERGRFCDGLGRWTGSGGNAFLADEVQ